MSDDFRKLLWLGGGLLVVVAVTGLVFALTGGRSDANTYQVPSTAMLPTFKAGEKVHADLGAYDDASPRVGDVIVFHPPEGVVDSVCGVTRPQGQSCAEATSKATHFSLVERIVAGPGDTVAVIDGRTVRNGKPATEDFITPCPTDIDFCTLPKPVTIPAGQYFVLGDNRGASSDSRVWGPIHADWIIGRVEETPAQLPSRSPS
jgi:signal peptidase I